jgi:glycosyltransferase involved in cell wall biosynthesis
VPDLVEDGVTGHLVRSGDAEALAAAMTDLLRDPGRRRTFGRAARARVLPAFGASRLVADIDALYGELLRAKRVGVPR